MRKLLCKIFGHSLKFSYPEDMLGTGIPCIAANKCKRCEYLEFWEFVSHKPAPNGICGYSLTLLWKITKGKAIRSEEWNI